MKLSGVQKLVAGLLTLMMIGILVVVGLFVYDKSVDVKDKAISSFTSVEDGAMERFDGKIVTGSEVKDAALEFQSTEQMSVLIKTGTNTAGFYALNLSSDSPVAFTPSTSGVVGAPGSVAESSMGTKAKMNDKSDRTYYVSRNAKFKAKIYRDESGEIRLLEFTQTK